MSRSDTRHVMFVISGLERGGAENQMVAVASALSDRGWDVTVLSFLPFSPDSWAADLRDTNVRLLTLNASSGIRRYVSLVNAIGVVRRLRPDVLVGFMFHGIMTARIAGRITGVPANVSSIRNERDGSFRERIMRATDRLTDAVTVQSCRLASEIAHMRVASSAHVHVIPNYIDVTYFDAGVCRDRTREELGVADDHFLWLAVGRLDEAKDYPNLMSAFSTLSGRHPNARLMIAGTGPLRSDLDSMIQRLGLGDRVRLLGLRLDMPALYAASDALVLSSAWEGMPNVVLEAMASATPVVATAVGAVPEIVSDGESGLIVPPRDHAALADAMAQMMELPDETRQAFGRAGYDFLLSEFSRESVIDRWEELFYHLLDSKA